MLSDSFRRSSGTSEKLQSILKNFRRTSAEHVAPRSLGRFENGADRMPAAVTSRQAPISPPLGPRARSHPSRGVAQAALSSRTGWECRAYAVLQYGVPANQRPPAFPTSRPASPVARRPQFGLPSVIWVARCIPAGMKWPAALCRGTASSRPPPASRLAEAPAASRYKLPWAAQVAHATPFICALHFAPCTNLQASHSAPEWWRPTQSR